MPRTARRDDRASRRARRQAAADRRIGHDMAYVYEWARLGGPVVAVLALAAGLFLLWVKVDHDVIAGWAGGIAVLMLTAYAVWSARTGSPHARVMARAAGTSRNPYWHAVAAAGVLLALASVMIWQQR